MVVEFKCVAVCKPCGFLQCNSAASFSAAAAAAAASAASFSAAAAASAAATAASAAAASAELALSHSAQTKKYANGSNLSVTKDQRVSVTLQGAEHQE